MTVALIFSLVVLDGFGVARELHDAEVSLLQSIDFSGVLMQGMLSFLLLAGALPIDLSELKAFRWQAGSMAIAPFDGWPLRLQCHRAPTRRL
jgi:CPA1 family monovalent cation:H+ antiporter